MGCKKRRWLNHQTRQAERLRKKEEVFNTGLKHLQAKYLNHAAYLAATKERNRLMETALETNSDTAWEQVHNLSREQGNALRETGRIEDYNNWWSEYLDLQEYVASI